MTNASLASDFATYFRVIPADTADLIEKVYQLRHKVYCEELGFEPEREDHLESDEYDKRSIHCLLFHKPSQAYIGCVRLVLADPQNPDAPFPFEHACWETLEWDFDSPTGATRLKYGEISRLAIAANFRRRRGEAQVSERGGDIPEVIGAEERRHFHSIALGLYVAITAMGLNHGLEGVFAMMEPRLARQLRRFGILFRQIGAAIEYRGIRAPFFISRDDLFGNFKHECRELLANIQNQLNHFAPS